MAENDQIRLEIAFEGGQIIGGTVTPAVSKAFQEAMAGNGPVFELEALEGNFWSRSERSSTSSAARARRNRLRLHGVAWRPLRGRFEGGREWGLDRGGARARRARRRSGDREGVRGALPPPLRPHLRLPAAERREQTRRRGPHEPDLREDDRVHRPLRVAQGAALRLALPDRAQPRHGPLPLAPALAARGGAA